MRGPDGPGRSTPRPGPAVPAPAGRPAQSPGRAGAAPPPARQREPRTRPAARRTGSSRAVASRNVDSLSVLSLAWGFAPARSPAVQGKLQVALAAGWRPPRNTRLRADLKSVG